ncbi:hypothetical protein [uncultured Porphyromonas sp.]|uniref:hypothetical protein n=1 Tax=uncultured Porphyromonas sp. TaxID=159274 RepID=UPI00261D4C22|nr:hypothetical protein [uncultured Porphyromonas sp.]
MTAQPSYEPSSREESPEAASHAIATPSSEPQSETGVPSATDESEEETHPEGAIRLMDGTILTCYPKPEEQLRVFGYKANERLRGRGMISIQDICAYVENKDKEESDTTNNY